MSLTHKLAKRIEELSAEKQLLYEALLHLVEVQTKPSCDRQEEWEVAVREARKALRAGPVRAETLSFNGGDRIPECRHDMEHTWSSDSRGFARSVAPRGD